MSVLWCQETFKNSFEKACSNTQIIPVCKDDECYNEWNKSTCFDKDLLLNLLLQHCLGMERYEELLRSMIEKSANGSDIQCVVCQRSYKSGQTTNLKNHLEAKHIDNIQFTCCACGGIFSSRASFRTHCRNFHKEIQNVPFELTELDKVENTFFGWKWIVVIKL